MRIHLHHQDVDMTSGPIGGHLISFSIPMLVGLCFQQLYTTVDIVVVGQYVGKPAVAAVGCTGSIINMLVGFCNGLALGATVLISRHFGAHDNARVALDVKTTMALTLLLSAVMTAAGMLIAPLALTWMDTPPDVIGEATTYLQIYFAGITGLMVYNMGAGILRAVGDSVRPLYFLMISSVLNVLFDLLFVAVFQMGVAGVAAATILSQFLSALLVMAVLSRGDAPYRVRWKHMRADRDTLREIVRIGLPAGFQQAVISFSNVFVQSYINFYGSDCMAGWSAYNRLDAFITLPANALAQGSATFSAQNYGARQFGRVKAGARIALIDSVVSTLVLTALVMLLRVPLLSLICEDAGMMRYGEHFILWISPFYALTCVNGIYSGVMRGVGDSRTPMIITISSFVVFRQIYLYVTRAMGLGFGAVTLAYPAGWVMCCVLMLMSYRHIRRERLREPV